MDEWTSIRDLDKIPLDLNDVLVTDGTDVCVGFFRPAKWDWELSQFTNHRILSETVTHWMRFPLPPQKSEWGIRVPPN